MIGWISKSSGSEAVAGLGTLIFVGVFAVSPIAFILVNSFNIASPGHPFRAGLQGWSDAFDDAKTLSAIGYSLLLSIRSFVGVAIAFAVSWLLVRIRIPGRALIEFFLWIAFFSKDGQEVVSRALLEPSRRVDVPTSLVPDYVLPQSGVKYDIDQYSEEWQREVAPKLEERLQKALGK